MDGASHSQQKSLALQMKSYAQDKWDEIQTCPFSMQEEKGTVYKEDPKPTVNPDAGGLRI